MPEIPDVVAGEPVASTWGNQIRDRSTERVADVTQRDTLYPIPIAGKLLWVESLAELQVYDGAAWDPVRTGPEAGIAIRQAIRFGDSINMQTGDTSQVRDYDISGFGFNDVDRLMLSMRAGANNQQSQRTLLTGQYTNINVLTVWFRGLGITTAGGCFFQVEMTEYVLPVSVSLPPIIP